MALSAKDDFLLDGELCDANKLTPHRRAPPPRYVPTQVTSRSDVVWCGGRSDWTWTLLTSGYGSSGQAVKVEANMYQTRLAPNAEGTV